MAFLHSLRFLFISHLCYAPVARTYGVPLVNFLSKLRFSLTMCSNGTQPQSKKPKTDQLTIGTHSGTFHCDEALACFMLKQLPTYANAKILRSRDNSVLEQCDIVVDVGEVFDPETKRFDHHQKSFQESLSTLKPKVGEEFKIRLSSAGLIYTFFGEEVINAILKSHGAAVLEERDMQIVYKQIYKSFIQEIDAIDNGVPMFDGEPLYTISTHISARIANLNPSWEVADYNLDEIFEKAIEKVGAEFSEVVLGIGSSWIKARQLVREAIENAEDLHPSGEILELKCFCPWKQHLAQLEPEYHIENVPKYVIYNEKPDSWRVICVPNEPSSFVCRKFLPESWRGLRSEELVEKSGIPEIIFVHHTGFIGGATTREAAFQMAVKALEAE